MGRGGEKGKERTFFFVYCISQVLKAQVLYSGVGG